MSTILSSLARQPTEKPVTKPKDYKKIKAKFNQMFTNRQKYVEKWKMIRDYQLPFLGVFDGEQDQSKLYTDKILTGIAWESCQIFASGVMNVKKYCMRCSQNPISTMWFTKSIWNYHSDKRLCQSCQMVKLVYVSHRIQSVLTH